MYIDGDTHYWPVNFLERVNHPGRGNIEFKKGAGAMIRYGETFPEVKPLLTKSPRIASFRDPVQKMSKSPGMVA